jgi:fatty-acid desaturase
VVWVGVIDWGSGLDAADLIGLVVMYVVSGLGITIGFHRLLTTARSPRRGGSS